MSRVHEGLAYKEFAMPEGLVQVEVCSESGLLPIPGLCDGCVVTEWFAEGTEPQYECDLHYAGMICAFDGKIACPHCPFAYEGVTLLPKIDGYHPELMIGDPKLMEGNQVMIEQEGGDPIIIIPDDDHFCQHTDLALATPGYEATIAAQMAQLEAVRQANEAAAAAAAAASVASQDG